MGQWKEESPQLESFRTGHGVPSSESKTNRRTSTDLSSTNPTNSQRNTDNVSSKIMHVFRVQHLLQNLSEDKVEQIRKTMLRQEEMFKEQVQALHKLYNVQRSAMHEIRNISCTQPKFPAFPTGAVQLQNETSKGLEIRGSFFQSGRGASSHNLGESHTIPITTPRSFSHSSLTAENIGHNRSQSPLWESDKNVINSATIKKKTRRTIDLERPPEEYLDDLDEEHETETTEAGGPDQDPVTSTEVSDTCRIQLGSNRQPSITTQMEEMTRKSRHREWSTADDGTFSQRNTSENVSLKRLRGSEDEVNLLADRKPTVAVGQQTSIPTKVESTSGRTCLPSQESKMDEKSSQWESINVDQNQKRKKEKWPFDMHPKDKHSEINTKPPLWLLQEPAASTRNTVSDASQKPSWMPVPVFPQPQGWNVVGDSLRPGQEYVSSPKDINLPDKMPSIDEESLNQAAQNCGQTGTVQENSMRQPKVTFQTILTPENYGGTNQLTPVVFPQGYPVGLGAAIPVLGLQWGPEGHRALTAQGFIFPPVNKNTEAGGHLSNAWCPPGTYFQLYPYQQQAIQDPRFSASCPSGDRTSMQITRNGSQCDTHVSSALQVGHFESLQYEERQGYKEISTIDGPAGSPGPESSTIPSYKAVIDVPVKLVENGVTLESRDRPRQYHSEGKTSSTCQHQLEDTPKPHAHVTEEKRQAHAKISKCNNCSLDTQETGHPEEESCRGCKDEFQATETIPREETALLDEYDKRDVPQCKSSERNISLMQREDTLHDEWSTEQRLPGDQKELQLFTKTGCICKVTDIQKHTSSDKMIGHCTEKSKHYASEIVTSKETNKTEDLDSSGHGSNNIGSHERKPFRGEDSQHLDPKYTYISKSTDSKARTEDEGIHQSKIDLISSTTESMQIKETLMGLVNEKIQSHGICCQASNSFGVTSQDITHGGMTETITSTSHAKIQGRGSPLNEHCDVKRTECESVSGDMDMEHIQTVSLRQSDQYESLINTQTNAESTCIKHTVELQDDKPTIERTPSEEKSSYATETRGECSTNSQESEEASEGREESESLAAMILLSLAPSESPVKGMSTSSVSTRKQSALQQQGHSGCIGSSSSHSSRDSTCHGNETKGLSRGQKRKTHERAPHGSVGWTKSIRGRRRRTQRPRSHFASLGKYQ